MSHCYRLVSKVGETLKGNEQFYAIDKAMCENFGVEPDPVHWYGNWENLFGQLFAMGMSFEQVRKILVERLPQDTKSLEILNWLDENYEVEAWREFGR